tara:strand:- start:118 stop:699 length:582 start_codon:yes stop_codon:yes gene_type:complete
MLIGLIGNKRVGKDTVANYLVDNFQFKKLAFADPIKEVISLLFDLDTTDNVDKEKITDYGVSLRTLYQKFGTELMQEGIYDYFPEMEKNIPKKMFWIQKLFKKVEDYQKKNHRHFIVSDVRFLHEVNYLKEKGAVLIRINKKTHLEDEHISENQTQELPDSKIDFKIDNNFSIQYLNLQIETIMKELFELEDI